jgi:hypothetical protein
MRLALSLGNDGRDARPGQKEEASMPLILWLLGVPLTLIIVLWLIGIV